MRIRLLKKWTTRHDKVLEKGTVLTVDTDLGKRLIDLKIATEDKPGVWQELVSAVRKKRREEFEPKDKDEAVEHKSKK